MRGIRRRWRTGNVFRMEFAGLRSWNVSAEVPKWETTCTTSRTCRSHAISYFIHTMQMSVSLKVTRYGIVPVPWNIKVAWFFSHFRQTFSANCIENMYNWYFCKYTHNYCGEYHSLGKVWNFIVSLKHTFRVLHLQHTQRVDVLVVVILPTINQTQLN